MTLFTITHHCTAPIDHVWRAWTDPALFVRWFGPQGADTHVLHFDLRPGGYALSRMNGPDGHMYARLGYREIYPPNRLVWDQSFADERGNPVPAPFFEHWPLLLRTEVTLASIVNGTELTLTWRPIDATDAQEQQFIQNMDSMTMGFTDSFRRLDHTLSNSDAL